MLTLQDVADQLGVHYMTAYRYVRTGRLDATKDGAIWQVRPDDLQEFVDGKDLSTSVSALSSFDDAWLRLFKRLIAGDETGCWNIIEECLTSGMTPHTIYGQLIAPALTEVGERWAAGNLDVVDEHLATATVTRLIGRLSPQFAQPGRSRGTVVLAMVAGDSHALPSAMLADELRLNRFNVIDLGADSPGESIAAAAHRSDSLVAIGICSLSGTRPDELPKTARLLTAAGFGGQIFVGGPGVNPSKLQRISPTPAFTTTSQDAIDFVVAAAAHRPPAVAS